MGVSCIRGASEHQATHQSSDRRLRSLRLTAAASWSSSSDDDDDTPSRSGSRSVAAAGVGRSSSQQDASFVPMNDAFQNATVDGRRITPPTPTPPDVVFPPLSLDDAFDDGRQPTTMHIKSIKKRSNPFEISDDDEVLSSTGNSLKEEEGSGRRGGSIALRRRGPAAGTSFFSVLGGSQVTPGPSIDYDVSVAFASVSDVCSPVMVGGAMHPPVAVRRQSSASRGDRSPPMCPATAAPSLEPLAFRHSGGGHSR